MHVHIYIDTHTHQMCMYIYRYIIIYLLVRMESWHTVYNYKLYIPAIPTTMKKCNVNFGTEL